jgi:DegV family protein with EDD domain
MKIGIVTDSTVDLKQDLLFKNNIEVIPLSVQFGNNTFKDGIDLSSDEFFSKLTKVDSLPGTSQPPLALFLEKYKEMAENYDTIISIHVSSALSGTYETAKLASKQLPDTDIITVDSATISLGLGFLTLLAAKLAQSAHSVEEILNKIEKTKEKLLLYFTVDEFTYMEQGGRIGKAKAFIGSILNINPIISISTETGEVDPLAKTRGKKRTMKKMISLALERLEGERQAWLGFAHGDRENDMEQFKEKLVQQIREKMDIDLKIFTTRISPVLGCHVGPSVYAGFIFPIDILK